MTGNRQRKRMGPSALCLKYRRLTVLPFSQSHWIFLERHLGQRSGLMRNAVPTPTCIFLRTLTSKTITVSLRHPRPPARGSLSPNAARRPGSGACVCRHARVHACVRACAARRNHEGARLSSICVHSFRKISSRPQEDAMRLFAPRVDREAQFNSCEGC